MRLSSYTPLACFFPLLLGMSICSSVAEESGVPFTGPSIDSLLPLASVEVRDPAAGILLTPHALTVDPLGRLWVLDRARARILRIASADGTGPSFSVGGLEEGKAPLSPTDLAASGSYLFLLDPSGPKVRLVDLDGHPRETVDLSGEVARIGADGFLASRILVGGSGDLWLVETRGARLLHFDRRGRFLDSPLENLSGRDRPKRIADVALAPDDGIVILDATRPALLTILANGTPRPLQHLRDPMEEPISLAVDRSGTQYVLDGTGRLQILARQDSVSRQILPGAKAPAGAGRLAITQDTILWRADPALGAVERWKIVRERTEDRGP